MTDTLPIDIVEFNTINELVERHVEQFTALRPYYAHLMAMDMNENTFDYATVEKVLMRHLENFMWDVLSIEHFGHRDEETKDFLDIEIAELEKEIEEAHGND
jgi:hypothetical protein